MRPLVREVELAELTHRLITQTQLRRIELTARQIRYRVATGFLHPVIDDVYSLDPGPFDFLTRTIAVCLRYPAGFLSGAASSRYWGLRRGVPDHFEFTVPEGCRPVGVPFAQFRYSNGIDPIDVRHELGGLRVASPARSVFEAAARLDKFGLESMIEDGLRRGQFDLAALHEVGHRLCGPGRRGTRLFREVVALMTDHVPVHSEEELLLLRALQAAGFADATPQCPIGLPAGGTIHVDVGVPSAMVGVEIDGPTHDDPIAVHRDKSRDLQAAARGWQVLRLPVEDVRGKPRLVVAYIGEVCRQRLDLFTRAG